jgi:ParB-like chromosome segregation protein Spo0J
MAGNSNQKLKVKTTKELTEQVKSLVDAQDLLIIKINKLEIEVKETKDEVNKWKKRFESKNDEDDLECEVCKLKLSSKAMLKQHKQENHGKDIECKHCDTKFKELWKLEVHLKLHKDVESF